MKNYLKVLVTPTTIKPLKRIMGVEEYRLEIKRKKSTEQIWKVESFEKAIEQIETHNKYIRDGIRHHDQPTTKQRIKNPETYTNPSKVIIEEKFWDWEKTDKTIKKRIKSLYKRKDWANLMKIHNDLKLTDDFYCCDGYKVKIIDNIEKAIKDGII